eukprot:TCALIF_02152-PB protein Name:"Protein of unknown function" AED:0.45 eAED:0.47 QI:0/0/0/1/0/0/3/0/76
MRRFESPCWRIRLLAMDSGFKRVHGRGTRSIRGPGAGNVDTGILILAIGWGMASGSEIHSGLDGLGWDGGANNGLV